MFCFKKLSQDAIIPTRSIPGSAGVDISSLIDIIIPSQTQATIPTGLATSFPTGMYLRIAPRSGLAHKYGIGVLAGVIDHGYTGEIKIILFNHNTHKEFQIKKGDRIAQLILELISNLEPIEVLHLEEEVRGARGFGSTGICGEVARGQEKNLPDL